MENCKQKQCINELSTALLKLLESKGYSPGTLLNYRRILLQISIFMKSRRIENYAESVGDKFMAHYNTKKNYSISRQQQIKTILRRLNDINKGIDYALLKPTPTIRAPSQFAGLLESYLKLCKSNGNKENSMSKKRKLCLIFLWDLADAGCNSVCKINTKFVGTAIIKQNNKDSYNAIREFFKHLHETGILKNDFSGIIPKYRRVIPLPTTYTDEEILRLENAIDRTTNKGKRDYAMVLFASRLGMRSGDIAELTFENIDFNCSRVQYTQKKTGLQQTLPLLPEIRGAVQDYFQHARPNVDNHHLFIRAQAPFDKISTGLIRHAFTAYFKAAGIDISNKKHGPHTLRSSMASSMVNSDIPYTIVRKALGHTDPQAIKHYAKVDIEKLRFHAINVPAPTGIFAMILQGREKL